MQEDTYQATKTFSKAINEMSNNYLNPQPGPLKRHQITEITKTQKQQQPRQQEMSQGTPNPRNIQTNKLTTIIKQQPKQVMGQDPPSSKNNQKRLENRTEISI